MEKVTVDSIIEYLEKQIENKNPVSPSVWIDAANKLNVLRGDEDDKLANLQQVVALKKARFIQDGKSVAQAKAFVECHDEFKNLLKQKAKCERIAEFIRIQKIRGRMTHDQLMNP